MALRSNGTVTAWGDNARGQCNIPALELGVTCTEIAAGGAHSLLLKSDGTVTAWGDNYFGQCNIPALEADTIYTQVAAGACHTLLVKSDGTVKACGRTDAFVLRRKKRQGDTESGDSTRPVQ